jgi:type I restriction enzyme S subunit
LKSLKIEDAGYSRHFKYLKRKKLPIPKSLTDQKRIAKVLSDCEQLIAWRKESIRLLDDYLDSVFLEMFGDRQGKPVKFENLIDIQNGQVDPRVSPYREMYHVGGANIESNTGKLVNVKKAKEEKLVSGKYLFDSSYILYSKIRPYLNKITIPPYEGICSADIYPIKPKPNKDLDIHFLKFELKSARFLAYAARNSGRANIPKINRKALNNYKVQLPELEDQLIFKKKAIKVEELKLVLTSSLKELENLYSSLSQKAFKGELDLSKVVVDEKVKPAQSPEETTKVSTKKAEQTSLKKAVTKPKGKRDIRNLTLLDPLGVPEELYVDKIADDYSPELDFIGDDLFYQFYLKDNFADQAFTFSDLQQKFNSYYIPKGQDFEPRRWKSILYKFMEGKKPLVEQIFDEASGTIKLKLTDEAFKA